MGLTKRGKGSKVMVVVEGQGLPLGVLVERAQKAEVRLAEAALAQVKVTRPVGSPRTRPREVVAGRGYDSEALRRRARGIKPCIPRRRNARPRRGRKPDLSGYRQRWVVERTFAWLGGFRRLVVRWERRAHIYLAFLLLACILILLRAISG
jgi:transposase